MITCNIATIAHWVQASEQVLSDEPLLNKQVGSLLQYGVVRKLEDELIIGAGNPGEIAGLTDAGNFTAFTATTSAVNPADVIGEGAAALDAAGWNAGLVILHPDDWHLIRSERDNEGAYVASGWNQPAAPSIWSIPVVTTPAISAGKLIVLDPMQVAVLDRQQANVEMGYHGNGFAQNLITIRAECRAGLAVFSPGAVMYGDLY